MKKRLNRILSLVFVAMVIAFAVYIHIQNHRIHVMPSIGEICEMLDGKWSEEFYECEGIPAEWCELQGGNFDECASACRHEPEAEVCTMQCVPVCNFVESLDFPEEGEE